MARMQQRNERADRAGWILQHHIAPMITAWLERQQELLDDPADGKRGQANERVKGAGATVFVPADEWGPDERIPVTSVEAIVMRGELMRDRREDVRDQLGHIVKSINSLERMLRRDLRGHPSILHTPELCDGTAKGYAGHMLAWRPYDRAHDNGWADASCRQVAGRSGLCPSCLLRMNRWRERNALGWITDGNEEHDTAGKTEVAA